MKAILFATLLIVALAAAASLAPFTAEAAGIQMLPPTDYSGSPCTGAASGLLQWDGSTPIKCVPGATGDNNGNVAVTGTLKPGSNGIQVGQNCTTEGAIGYDAISTLHQLGFCNSSHVWAPLDSAVSCPSGETLVSITNGTPVCAKLTTSVSYEYLPLEIGYVQYVDCPSGTTAIACNSVVIPSGSYSCQVTPGTTDPGTGLSSCVQAGCGNHMEGDTSYYTTATCMRMDTVTQPEAP